MILEKSSKGELSDYFGESFNFSLETQISVIDIVEKILEGKMKKFYSESTFMDQQYILDQDKSVNQIITEFSKNNKFEIIEYNLFAIGS